MVIDEGPRRVMRFGSSAGSPQSAIVRGQPRAVPVEYVRYALLGLAHHGHPTRLLMVGLGGGTFSTLVHRALPRAIFDVVEIDPTVVAAARAYFGLREDEHYRVHIADAVDWIAQNNQYSGQDSNQGGGKYDFVLLDAYAGEEIPPALRSEAFFRSVERRLASGGVVAINIAEPGAEGNIVARAFRSVFTPFDCYQTPVDGNVMIFAARETRIVDRGAMLRWLHEWDARGLTDFSLSAIANPLGHSGCRLALSGTD